MVKNTTSAAETMRRWLPVVAVALVALIGIAGHSSITGMQFWQSDAYEIVSLRFSDLDKGIVEVTVRNSGSITRYDVIININLWSDYFPGPEFDKTTTISSLAPGESKSVYIQLPSRSTFVNSGGNDGCHLQDTPFKGYSLTDCSIIPPSSALPLGGLSRELQWSLYARVTNQCGSGYCPSGSKWVTVNIPKEININTPNKRVPKCEIRSGRYMPYAIASCLPGERSTGGGCQTESTASPILASCPSNGGPGCNPSSTPTAWFCSVNSGYVTSYASCCTY